MRLTTRLKYSGSLIDMTPLVDVIFLLLIFFIVTSHILPLKSLYLEPVEIETSSPALTTQLVIVIDHEEVIYVGSKKAIVDLEGLQNYLKQEAIRYKKEHEGVTPTVTLYVDRRVSYEIFLQVLAQAQASGLPARLAYQQKEQI